MSEQENPHFSKKLFVHVVSDCPEPALTVAGAEGKKLWISGDGIEVLLDMEVFSEKRGDRRKMLENENLLGHVMSYDVDPLPKATKHRLTVTVSIDPIQE